MFPEIMILVLLILLNAFFAASEIALISLNDTKLKLMTEAGDKKAKLLQNLLGEPSRFLATIQIGITLAGFLASAFAAESFSDHLVAFLLNLGIPLSEQLLDSISVILITMVLSYFTLVLGELVPKRIAMQKAEPISMLVVRPLTILSKITSPFVKLLTNSTNIIVKLCGIDPDANEEEVTEEEIRMMIDVGEEKGTIRKAEKTMINNVFEFDNKTVSDVMTHRTSVVGIPVTLSLKEVLHIINVEKYTRFPVYEDNIDNIVGILHVKDVLQYIEQGSADEFQLQDIIRTPYFVHESKATNLLFRDLQKKKIHMAVVLDEYGGVSGIVTIEDLVEEIVGNIFDEHDDEEPEVIQIDERTYSMKGTLSLYDVEKVLDVKLPTDDYDTLSGFLIGLTGSMPGQEMRNQEVEYQGFTFTVEEADERLISKVRVTSSSEE